VILMRARFIPVGVVLAAGLVTVLLAAGLNRSTGAAVEETVLNIEVGEGFAFAPGELRCPAGRPVRLRLHSRLHAGGPDLLHNIALLAAGTDAESYGRATVNARLEDRYVPAEFRSATLAVSTFGSAGEDIELAFTAPAEPGAYPLVCTFPGHCLLGMKAILLIQ